ncbi:MAG TPA: cytochrome P460 family protein [Pirellulales bacterium]|jgi:hypothetical protein
MVRKIVLLVFTLVVMASALTAWSVSVKNQIEARELAEPVFSEYVDKAGQISLPAKYRTSFVHLGSYAVATKPGVPVNELHNVYTRPEDVVAFQREGNFPDGAILVKEVYRTAAGTLSTGEVKWASDIKLWFVMVKDQKGRFENSVQWGDGWGWALFHATAPKINAVTDYTANCRACHIPARKDDWIYLRGYPFLKTERPTK